MTNLSFNRELAIALYQSSEDFPVDFDHLAWQWFWGFEKYFNLGVDIM